MTTDKPSFKAGKNIAIKVPSHEFKQTVVFYSEILGLPTVETTVSADQSRAFQFGDKTLWIDSVETLSQAETWFEIRCNNAEQARRYFNELDLAMPDSIEPLPKTLSGFWLSNPANIIHLICEQEEPA